MRKSGTFIFLLLCTNCLAERTFLDNPRTIQWLRQLRDWGYDFLIGRTGAEGGRLFKVAEDQHKIQERVPDDVPFPCNVTGFKSSEVPTSVHQLRPGDIDIIAGIGDSLTAGSGIFGTSVLHIFSENRGVAFSAGGQANWRKYLTLPNIIKEFNPNLFGYALADSPPHDFKNAQYNVGEVSAISEHMPFMAKELIRRMRNDPRVDIENHWKLITVFIGSNDFCSEICYLPSPWSALEKHRNDMVDLLRVLRDNLPRTFVALLPNIYLKNLVDTNPGDRWICDMTRSFECSCLFGLKYRSFRPEYYQIMKEWQKIDEEVAALEEFQREDFVVMFSPSTANASMPKLPNGETDFRYFSADCFHVSQRTHAAVANSLWNNLLEPVGEKMDRHNVNLFERFLCPTEDHPYFVTWKNIDGRKLPT